MERDKRDADNFWSDRLLECCWDIWKQGFQWIIVGYLPSFWFELWPLFIMDMVKEKKYNKNNSEW